jgi:hypothetical protein
MSRFALSGSFRNALAIGLALVLILVIALAFNKPSLPILEVKEYSLNPNTINAGGSTTLSFTVKNNDQQKNHFLRVNFNASPMVTFWQGSQILPTENDLQYFTRTLNPSDLITTYITVKASLPPQTSTVTYSVVLNFYVDGSQFDSRQINLKVES